MNEQLTLGRFTVDTIWNIGETGDIYCFSYQPYFSFPVLVIQHSTGCTFEFMHFIQVLFNFTDTLLNSPLSLPTASAIVVFIATLKNSSLWWGSHKFKVYFVSVSDLPNANYLLIFQCNEFEFGCNSGSCISLENRCDEEYNCRDKVKQVIIWISF